jgi:hypothetical protein
VDRRALSPAAGAVDAGAGAAAESAALPVRPVLPSIGELPGSPGRTAGPFGA